MNPLAAPSGGLLRARRIISLADGVAGDAVWWEAGRIRGVGSAADLEREAPASLPRYELPRALVTPGFVDGHTHFAMWALGRRQGAARRRRDASGGGCSRRRGDAGRRAGCWGRAGTRTAGATRPDRHALDAVQQGPVYLDSLDVHAAWVNTAALAAAGVDRDTPDPFGGRIVRDAGGEPTGLLLERAVELVARVLPEPSA